MFESNKLFYQRTNSWQYFHEIVHVFQRIPKYNPFSCFSRFSWVCNDPKHVNFYIISIFKGCNKQIFSKNVLIILIVIFISKILCCFYDFLSSLFSWKFMILCLLGALTNLSHFFPKSHLISHKILHKIDLIVNLSKFYLVWPKILQY